MFLEHPSLIMKIANYLGKPVEKAAHLLPAKMKARIFLATQKTLLNGLKVVCRTIPTKRERVFPDAGTKEFAVAAADTLATRRWHTSVTFGSGALGGFFGMASLPVELPITTAVILRSIASIASEFGLDIQDPEVQLECLYVLSLGSTKTAEDDALDSAYWASRLGFSQILREAAKSFAGRSVHEVIKEMEKGLAPVLAKLLAKIGARFEIAVTEKAAAELLPIVGAAGGGLINAAFTNYFSQAARCHFGLRALENTYGQAKLKEVYDSMI